MNVDSRLLEWGSPSNRQLPGAVPFSMLTSVKLPTMESVAYARRELVKPGCVLHPSTWNYPSTVVQFGGDRPAYAMFFGKNDLDFTICRFFKRLPNALGQASALERWRLHGGSLRKGNSSGILKYFVLWYNVYPFTAQKKPFRVYDKPPALRLQEWLNRDNLEIIGAFDTKLKTQATLVDAKHTLVVPQYQAETWGHFAFGGDIELNLLQCLEWKLNGTRWRAEHLNQEQAARYRLFTRLPKKRIQELTYHDSAPCYS